MQLSISLNDDLVKKLDERRLQLFASRSSYIALALAEKLQHDDVAINFPRAIDILSEALLLEKNKNADISLNENLNENLSKE